MAQHGCNESDSQQLADLAMAICWVWLHKLSEDSLSLDPPQLSKDLLRLHSTNSARFCWAFTPQTQPGFAEPSLHRYSMYTAQWLSTEGAESGITTGMYMAQWLSAEGAESGSTTVRCWAQWLSVEGAESDFTVIQYMYRSGLAHLLSRLVSWSL